MILVTAAERAEIALLFEFVREWRNDDARWKELHGAEHDRMDQRVGAHDDRFVAQDALQAQASERGLSNRARFAIGLTALFSAAGLVVQIAGRVL